MKNKINTNKILLLLVTVWLMQFQVHGQGNGYPWMDGYYRTANQAFYSVPFDANKTVNEGDVYYADADRAEIISIYRPTISVPYRIVLTNNSNDKHGRFKTFAGVDSMKNEVRRFFLVQTRSYLPMDDNYNYDPNGNYTSGNCAEVILYNCYDSSGLTVALVGNGGAVDYFFKNSINDRIQIVRVPIFRNFSLNGGIVTCHAYDGHTGGFLPLRAENLSCKSGIFDVAAKGYYPENITWGTPSTGTAGDAVYNGSATIGTYRNYATICPNTSGLVLVDGNYGKEGDLAVPNSINGTNSTGSKIKYGLPHTSPFIKPKMGEAGYFKVGNKAGNGGQGGGHGGPGGSAGNGNLGTNGQPGTSAGSGGLTGTGAKGGGVIMLRIENMIYPTGHIFNTPGKFLFYINGQNGGNGGNGTNGGNGGNGGDGGVGSIVGSTIFRPGGYGAPGQGGLGATGGDGSNGGNPGTLGLHLKNFYPNPSAMTRYQHLVSVTNSTPGKRGYGGQGGYRGSSTAFSQTNETYTLPPGKTWCSGGGGVNPMQNICNCDSVFWALSSSVGGVTTISLTKHQYVLNKYDVWVEYDTGEVKLKSLYRGGNITSHCILFSDTQCIPMFDKMKGASLTSNWGNINLLARQAQRTSSSPLVVSFEKDASPFTTALLWNGSEGVLYDEMEPGRPICYKGSCDPKNPENRAIEVPNGEHNNEGQPAETNESVDEKNIGFFEQWPEALVWHDPVLPPSESLLGGIDGASVTKDIMNLNISVPGTVYRENVQYTLVNALGQTMQSGTMDYQSTKNVPVDNLPVGMYSLILSAQSGNFVYKFVVY